MRYETTVNICITIIWAALACLMGLGVGLIAIHITNPLITVGFVAVGFLIGASLIVKLVHWLREKAHI